MMKTLTSARALCHRFSRRFANDKKGVAAVEFALIAPILLYMYFGMAETAMLIDKDRNVSHTSSVVSDLVTQANAMNSLEVADIMAAGIMVMGIDDSSDLANLSIELTSFELPSASGDPTRIGRAILGTPIPSTDKDGNPTSSYDGSELQGNTKLLSTNSGIVVARVAYNYQSPTTKFVGLKALSETFKNKPRKSPTIPFNDAAGVKGANFTCSATLSGTTPVVTC